MRGHQGLPGCGTPHGHPGRLLLGHGLLLGHHVENVGVDLVRNSTDDVASVSRVRDPAKVPALVQELL